MSDAPENAAASPAEGAEGSDLWLRGDEQAAWRHFIFGTYYLLGRLGSDLEGPDGIDLTLGEYEILVRLSEAPGRSLRMSDLAALVVHSRSRLTHTVTRLERRGILERVRCADDGRGRKARLTDDGVLLLERAAPVHVRSVRTHLYEVLGRERFLQLGELMADLIPEDAPDYLPEQHD